MLNKIILQLSANKKKRVNINHRKTNKELKQEKWQAQGC